MSMFAYRILLLKKRVPLVLYMGLTFMFITRCNTPSTENEKVTFQQFTDLLNEHKAPALATFLEEDFIFTDSRGQVLNGCERVASGWKQLFNTFPDYTLEVKEVITVKPGSIAAFGYISGTYKGMTTNVNENYWRVPVAWRVFISPNGKLKSWEEYHDTKIIHEIIESNQADSDF